MNIWPKYCLGKGAETVPCKISYMKGVYICIIGGVEINPGPGSTSDEEIIPMEIDCMDDTFESFETLQHTPISSQVLPMTSLDLFSQCSFDVSMTPEKSFSTTKSRKRIGYRARKDRNRVNIKK